MLEFAVTVEGITQAQWVLAVDPTGERLLIVHDDKSMHWHAMKDCRFVKVVNPDAPRPVIPVQPPPNKTPVVLPNGMITRSLAQNGHPR